MSSFLSPPHPHNLSPVRIRELQGRISRGREQPQVQPWSRGREQGSVPAATQQHSRGRRRWSVPRGWAQQLRVTIQNAFLGGLGYRETAGATEVH